MRRTLFPLLLLAACGVIEDLPDRLFDRRTEREKYEDGLTAAGLHATALGGDWKTAGERALAAAPVVTLPVEEQGYFAPGEPAALSWRVAVRRGQRLSLVVTFAADSTARLFLDVWRDSRDTVKRFERILEADSGTRALSWSPRRDGELIVRVQPELLRGGRFTARLGVDPVLAFPVENRGEADIKSRFGAPRDGGRRDHHGVDIFAPRGTPALASADGVVRRVEVTNLGGKVVWLRDRDGHALYYAHLDRQYVTDGQEVTVGDTLGFIGNTGNARTTPPHLHFGIYSRGEGPLDPWYFIYRPRGTVPKLTADTSRLGDWLRTPPAAVALLSRPDARDSSARMLEAHTPLRILAATGNWYRVRLPDGQTGFVGASKLESLARPLEVATLASQARVLTGPDDAEESVVRELRGTVKADVFGWYGDYALARIDGQTGWILDRRTD
jgi:murein DD-endopeptidase MepM/ murein hydrolase activator NlpD/SH3-like domain-containing protein